MIFNFWCYFILSREAQEFDGASSTFLATRKAIDKTKIA
jgi:hypothetical protein